MTTEQTEAVRMAAMTLIMSSRTIQMLTKTITAAVETGDHSKVDKALGIISDSSLSLSQAHHQLYDTGVLV